MAKFGNHARNQNLPPRGGRGEKVYQISDTEWMGIRSKGYASIRWIMDHPQATLADIEKSQGMTGSEVLTFLASARVLLEIRLKALRAEYERGRQ